MSTQSWDEDDEFITACLNGGEKFRTFGTATWTRPVVPVACRWCTHDDHGLPCRAISCGCESSRTARDDSWRPVMFLSQYHPAVLMHETGVDGYAARVACGQTVAPGFNPNRIRQALLGEITWSEAA